MPIYEYVCEACGRLTEVMQRSTDPAPVCPECGEAKLARIVSRTSFQLKGGGWYSDLYATPKKKREGGADSAGGAPSATGSAAAPGAKAASEAKPAATTEPKPTKAVDPKPPKTGGSGTGTA